MLEQMSASEYMEWVAYFDTEPFPETRADIRNAQIVQAILYTGTRQKKHLKDLMMDWWGDLSRPQTPAQIKRNMQTIASMMPGKFKFIKGNNSDDLGRTENPSSI